MQFTGYFILYGLICSVLSLVFYIDHRKNRDSLMKFVFSISVEIALITVLYSSIQFLSEYRQYWLLSRRNINIILKIVQYVLIILIHYGFLKTLYNDWAESE